MSPTSSTHKQFDAETGPSSPSSSSYWCCGCNVNDVVQGVQLNAKALNAPPPIQLVPGHANADGEARGMAPPTWGHVEVVNKNKEGEIIAVLVAQNAAELALHGRDPANHVPSFLNLGCMPEQTVIHGTFEDGVDALQVACSMDRSTRASPSPGLKPEPEPEPKPKPSLQVALYYGSKYKTIEKARGGNVKDNFEFLKVTPHGHPRPHPHSQSPLTVTHT